MSSIGPNLYAIRAKGAFEKSKLKGTYPNDTNPPKEKHVASNCHTAILWTLQGQNMETAPEMAYNSLCQRLMTSEWVVALKTEIILHRAVEQVGPGYSARLAELNIPMQNFNDPSEKGSAHNRIIQDYFVYIRSKAHNHSRRGSVMLSQPADRAKLFERMDAADLLREVGFLLTQLQNIVKLAGPCEQALRNYNLRLTQNAVFHLLTDATPLYMTCSIGVDRIIDRYQDMDKGLGEIAIEHYKRFESAGRLLAKFFSLSQHLPTQINPPSFVQRPREVVLSMQSALEEKEGRVGGSASASEPLGADLHMSKEELEMQRQLLEQYERENEQRRQKDLQRERERARERELLSDPIPEAKPQPQPPKEPSKTDLIMSGFESAPVNPNPMAGMGFPMGNPPMPGAPPMGNPAMSAAPAMVNPQMPGGGMNPMMAANPAMFNPMMNPMMNPFMSMMAPMYYPTMPMAPMGMMPTAPAPQVKSNLDPTSKASGSVVSDPRDRKGGAFAADPFASRAPDPFGKPGNDPFTSAKATNPFETNPPQARASNPFDDFGPAPAKPGAYGQSSSKKQDPFSGLL